MNCKLPVDAGRATQKTVEQPIKKIIGPTSKSSPIIAATTHGQKSSHGLFVAMLCNQEHALSGA
jgi:hypothetical protein